jgi:hypothetical protein
MKLQINPNSVASNFSEIAESLINNYLLKVNDTLIEFCDLEFYWNEPNHKDINTHEHNYQNGQLRPHGSGYDIALRNGTGYGGILIRGVFSNDLPTYGPIRSADVIFRMGGHLNGSGLTISLKKKIIRTTFPVFKTKRVGLVKDDDFSTAAYRFISCRSDYLRQVEGKLALCDEIKKEAAWIAIANKAISLPALKYNNAETL